MKQVKRILRELLSLAGITVTRMKLDARMEGAIRRAARRHPAIATIVDVGASDGRWTEIAMIHFRHSHYLLIEAQPIHRRALEIFARRHPGVRIAHAAAGDRSGEIYFWANDPLGGQASHAPFATDNIVVPLTTVDHEVATHGLAGPFLLKLDTHGFETEILQGAAATLRDTDVAIIECYNYLIAPGCKLFYEMCEHMTHLGFACVDLVDVSLNPSDETLWQMDIVFERWPRSPRTG